MKLHKFKQIVNELGFEKAMVLIDGEEIVDGEGNPVDVQKVNLERGSQEDDEPQEDGMDEKAIGQIVSKAIADGFAKAEKSRISVGDVNIDDKGGFECIGELAVAVMKASNPNRQSRRVDPRLELIQKRWGKDVEPDVTKAPSNVHYENTGSDGGFLMPPHFIQTMWDLVTSEDGLNLLNMVDSTPTGSDSVKKPADETTPWDSANGVQAYWEGEGDQRTASKLNLKGKRIEVNTLSAFVNASSEAVSDVPMLNNILTTKAARKIQWKINDAIIRGTGVGQPLGILNSQSLITQNEDGSQAADTINLQNVLEMGSRLLDDAGAIWLANSDCRPQIGTINDGTNNIFMFSLQEGVPSIMDGKPLYYTELCDTIGDASDIILFNPRGYFAAVHTSGMSFASSIHLYFDYNVESFRWNFRMGGAPYLETAVSANLSSNTKSHAVQLQART